MPRLSDSMEEGTIVKWLIADGQQVQRGQELVEIETDKATIAHLAEAAGVLEILAPEGTTLPVGATIARVGQRGAAEPPAAAEAAPVTEAPPVADAAPVAEAAPVTEAPPVAGQASAEPAQALGGGGATTPAGANGDGGPPAVREAQPQPQPGSGAPATPLARRLAAGSGIDLASITGSGPRGRVTRGDVLAATGAAAVAPRAATPRPAPIAGSGHASGPASAQGAGAGTARGAVTRVAPSRAQALVARRMAESKATIPHFQVQTEVAMDAAVALRTVLKASSDAGAAPSLNDLVVKACAGALRRHPRANSSYADGAFELFERVNIGVAVASGEDLVVPVVMDADTLSLGAIARETRRLAALVRSGEITPAELSGATFTVSNLGMFGMTAITPVINPPQAAILGVGSLREMLARGERDGEVVQRTLMTLTLSCDHRILHGAQAARLLAEVRTLLEEPMGLAL